MPHVLDDTDTLAPTSPSAAGDALRRQPRGLPALRRAWPRFLALFQHLLTPPPRLQTRQQEHSTPGAPRFETPLDLLARHHPSLHLWLMSGMG